MKTRYLIPLLCLAVIAAAALIFHLLYQPSSSAETAETAGKQFRKMQVNRTVGSVEDVYRSAAFAAVCTVEKKYPSAYEDWGAGSQQISTDFTVRILRTTNPDEGAVGDTVLMRMRGGETEDTILEVSASDPDHVAEGQTYLIFFSAVTGTDTEKPFRYPIGAEYGIYAQTDMSDGTQWHSLHGDWSIDASTLVPTDAGDIPLLSLFSEP